MYPRLIKKVLTPDGKPVLGDDGKPVVPDEPKIRGDLRHDFTPQQIDLVRRGLWKVVNEDGGTGGKARMKDVQVAGKTGTATAKRNGKPDTIAWFVCFAPFDNPKYAIAVMVNGGEHGGSVAGPIAGRILEETFAMERGTYTPELAWLEPAHKDDAFQMIAAVDFKGAPAGGSADDQETLHSDTEEKSSKTRRSGEPKPDIRPEADAQGRVKQREQKPKQAQPQQPPPDRRNFFERFFRPNKAPKATPPVQDQRRPH